MVVVGANAVVVGASVMGAASVDVTVVPSVGPSVLVNAVVVVGA